MTILTRFRRIHCFFDYPTITVSFLSNKLFSNDTTSPCLLYIRYPKNAWSPYVSSNKSRHVLPSFIVHLGDSYQTSSVPLQMMNSLLFILYRGKFPLIVDQDEALSWFTLGGWCNTHQHCLPQTCLNMLRWRILYHWKTIFLWENFDKVRVATIFNDQ